MARKKFLRQDFHKKPGFRRKKKQKWRSAKGMHSKVRLGIKGKPGKPKIGFGNKKFDKNSKKQEVKFIRNLKELGDFDGNGIIIAKVGKKKRDEIIKKADEKKIKVLNKYKEKKGKRENGGGELEYKKEKIEEKDNKMKNKQDKKSGGENATK